jgi:drug/metabolite transporter (DMT)-like permease
MNAVAEETAKTASRSQAIGLALATASMLLATITDVTVRLLSVRMPTEQLMVLRSLWALAALLPFIRKMAAREIGSKNIRSHMACGLVAGVSAYLFFYALAKIPIAEANAYLLSEGAFVVPLAAIFLREKITAIRLAAVVVGIIGVCVILWPQFSYATGIP